ncbi:hypothetical protein BCR33DRAFT_733725 [Rhizoclosmatium globosum]|uniref:DUF4436 domain-containing protein n=1 Tax=Rhizoclosmatium globosum TaxID=329046 RepID=A0A1Y2CWI9_9FUNG|nr:hypothetical protein BCR33DRAFT_733725 [Rhizoclosmatium globosum]|eukprot:ORY51399.1 hypothetical protein BCR33DRAFT_733725 [Rhizoclosmatium globosum]
MPEVFPRKKFIAIILGTALAVAAIIAGLTAIAITAKNKSKGREDSYVTSAVLNPKTDTFLEIDASLSAVDVNGATAKLKLTFALSVQVSNFSLPDSLVQPNPKQSLYYETKYPMNVTVGGQTFSFAAGRALLSQSVTVPIDGDFNMYPFDEFLLTFNAAGTYGAKQDPLPILLVLFGSPNGFDVTFDSAVEDATNTQVYGVAKVDRNITVRAFAILIILTMWFLALAAVIFTACLYIFNQTPVPPTVGFHIALLFAMPGVRNTMPQAPAIGALIDQMALVWCMCILAGCVLLQYFKLGYPMVTTGKQ